MPILSALAFAVMRPQESVAFAFDPPTDRVVEYALGMRAANASGADALSIRMVIAMRATRIPEGFRLNRYVSVVTAEGSGPYATVAKTVNALAGKTFPLALNARGERKNLPPKRWENDPSALPSFIPVLPAQVAVGAPIAVGESDLPAGTLTLREVRPLGSGRAAVFGFEASAKAGESGSGTLVVSVEDGMPLLLTIAGRTLEGPGASATRLRLDMRRVNVPGLDRLAADLRMNEEGSLPD